MQAGPLKALPHRPFLPLERKRHLPDTANTGIG